MFRKTLETLCRTPAGYAARWVQNKALEGGPSGAFDNDRISVPAG